METEILIVGAGPSGAAAAVQPGQLGIRDVRRFTPEFATGHLVRELVSDGMLDRLARTYNTASFQRAIRWIVGAALAGSTTQEAPAPYGESTDEEVERREDRERGA